MRAQLLSVGVTAGVPVTDAVEGSFGVHSAAPPYTVGPMVEFRLPRSFAVEVDALYKRTGYDTNATSFGLTTAQRVRANSWEFPILAKYYLPGYGLPLRPFAEVGYVVREISGVEGTTVTTGGSNFALDTRFLLHDNPTHGVAVGGGVDFKFGRLHVAPEARYTHWGGHPFDEFGSRGFFVSSVSNQFEFLAAIRF